MIITFHHISSWFIVKVIICFKVKAAEWALDHGVATVICNGHQDHAIRDILAGKRVGTFFTKDVQSSAPVEVQAMQG
jgi:glutamate 5-kinase